MSRLGETIKLTRSEHRLSLAQLARTSGLSKGFLSQVESGRSNPSLDSLAKIAQALDTSPTQLLARAGSGAVSQALPPMQPTHLGGQSPGRTGGDVQVLQVLDVVDGGTHLLIELTPEDELASPLIHNQASVLCVALEGSMRVTQPGAALALSTGGIAVWDGGTPYALRSLRNLTARLLLFVPHTLPLPTVGRLPGSELDAAGQSLVDRGAISGRQKAKATVTSGDGPLRLVAMRAQRLAERKRNP